MIYRRFNESFIISSSEAEGFSLSTADTALFTFAFVNPSITNAVTASSVAVEVPEVGNSAAVSVPAPFTTLSLSSRMSLCALFRPIPLMLLILFMSSASIAFRISSAVRDESIMRAVDAPIPDTPIRSLNNSRSSLVANP